MALTPGTRLGSYEVVSALGSGGMGEVYRATDTKLKRQVAIKTLPPSLAADRDRLARFQREAEVLASLNHPNIAGIYGLQESEGVTALVMELVEGEDLSQRIARGPMPVDEALPIARQIAEALEAAHEQGIVHRDLKPANIKVRADGTVKVLDFGLAKAIEPAAASSVSVSRSPTITSPAMTAMGIILGTAAYMSPEQAKGRAVDRRTDVWAFGAVLYEMLSGRRAFDPSASSGSPRASSRGEGEDVSDTLAQILMKDPDWTALPATVPPTVVSVLQRCLQKDRKQRVRDIGDVSLALEGAFETSARETAAPVPAQRSRATLWGRVIASGLVGALAAGSAVWSWTARAPTPAPAAPTRVSVMVPANRPVATGWYPGRSLAISPDGTQLVYISVNVDPGDRTDRGNQLALRSLATLAVRDLPGTTGARQPFFSPDGQWVGFFTTGGELKKVSLAGGNPVTLVEKINGGAVAFGVWARDNTIIYGTLTTGLRRVSAEGGAVTDLTTLDAAQNESFHLIPALTPSHRAVLFTGSGERIEAVILDSRERRVVLENARIPLVLGNGHLLFQRDEAILIAPFDPDRLTVTGPAVPLIDDVRRDSLNSPVPLAELAASATGSLAYLPSVDTTGVLGVVNRDGTFQALGPLPDDVFQPRVSPDGQSVAFIAARGRNSEARIYDRRRGSTAKLTADGRDEGIAWHPDGRSLSTYSARKDTQGIFLKNTDGSERLLVRTPPDVTVLRNGGWSPDGMRLAYTVQTGLQHDIWMLTMGDTPTAAPFLTGAASEHSPMFSPDGRWLAYASNESGRFEVYVRRYPAGERLAVSTTGGHGPVWRRDGKELFFEGTSDGAAMMMAVSVTPAGASLSLGKPVQLFEFQVAGPSGTTGQYRGATNGGPGYDILPDGRFVMIRRADPAGTREIVLVQNFVEELKRLAPAK